MGEGLLLNIVATECPPAIEAKFNKWYNGVHVPMLFKYPGLKRVTRYQLLGESPGQAKYLACYEFKDAAALSNFQKSPEFAAAMDEMQGTWKGGGFDIKWMAVYQPLKTWER
ncbi:MAG TPA: DUF4286 family protein [Dehalococcoidales bacterium]|nr:MAG: hypothetical protein A2Z05_08785 [Chloroflexi bacterium RBG_16_60_22]HJX13488.1 DUF4286 family protein [Dehalococcoidales bacterium]